MNEPEPIDLSPLDPERDARRWATLMEATRLRVAAEMSRRNAEPDVLYVLSGWARPILAAAAVLVIVLGTAIATHGLPTPPRPSEARRLAYLAESSIVHGRAPSGAELMHTILPRGRP